MGAPIPHSQQDHLNIRRNDEHIKCIKVSEVTVPLQNSHRATRGSQTALVHGKFCKINGPVSSINNMGCGERTGPSLSQKSQTQWDPDLNKPTVKKHFGDEWGKLNIEWAFFKKFSSVRCTEVFMSKQICSGISNAYTQLPPTRYPPAR